MTLILPIIFKILLFMYITEVKHNHLLIFAISSVISILILSLLEILKKPKKRFFQVGFYLLFSIIIFADVMYYSYFQSLPSVAIIGQAKQLGAVTESIISLLSLKNLLLIVDLPAIILLVIRGAKLNLDRYNSKKVIASLTLILILLFTYTHWTNRVSALTNQEPYTFHSYDIFKNIFSSDSDQYINLEELLKGVIKEDEELYGENRKLTGIAKDRNLIVIQVEALQNFVVNYSYNNQEITPYINSLIKDDSSIYFDEYYQLLGRGNTSDAEFVTNNSLHPSMEDASYTQFGGNTYYGLPWLLRDNGYQTYVFHGYKKDFWNRDQAYVNQGFQKYFHEDNYDFQETIIFGISDREFYAQTLDYLEEISNENQDPFYSFIISLSSHTPYNIDKKYHRLELDESLSNNIVGNYLQAINYADEQLGVFIQGLKEKGLYENSVIAIYGDHFGINNSAEEAYSPMEEILGEKYNFDHIMNVPLIISVPGEKVNERISQIGSQIDFYPTIINLLGLSNDKGLMFGKDLINYSGYNFVAPQTIMRKGSFIDGEVIFNISRDGIFENSTVTNRKTRELLDIEDYRDKYEYVLDHINASDTILKNDLLAEIIQRDGDFEDFNISLGKEVPEQSKIESFGSFITEDIQINYNKGNYINRVEIDENTDLLEMSKWLEENEKGYLIIKTKDGSNLLLEKIKDEYPKLKDRFIAEIDNFDDLFLIQRRGFRNIILNITNTSYSDEQIRDFLKLYDHFGLIVGIDRDNSDFIDYINQSSLRIFREDTDRLVQIK